MTYVNLAMTPQQDWRRLGRGHYESADGKLYVARTRDGWAYGTITDGRYQQLDEVSRPLKRAMVLAEKREVVA